MDHSQLLRGTTSLLLLAALRDGELYGYEIAQRIRERSGAVIEPGEGWLYPALHQLEAEGALQATWRPSARGPRRRYYHLTPGGRRLLDDQAEAFAAFVRGVHLVTLAGPADG